MTGQPGTSSVSTQGRPTDRWAFALPTGWERFAGEAGATAVYRPTASEADSGISESITEVEVDGVVGCGPEDVGALILSGGFERSASADLDGRPGARLTSIRSVRDASGWAVVTHQVTYVISRDDAAGAWLALSVSTVWDRTETYALAMALIDLFDAAMATFRWTGPGADPARRPERRVPGFA